MWNIDYIDKQILFRLGANNIKIDISEDSFTGGLYTHVYSYKGNQIIRFNRYPDGSIRKNNFVINPILEYDPKDAVDFKGRPRSWGKKLTLLKCGASDMEQFNYISELIYSVCLKLSYKRNN